MTELLFLYECTTLEPPQLRPIAERLGLTVQAASHAYRLLAKKGLVEIRDGRYRPTVRGVAWLHETLDGIRSDVQERLDHLHVIRSCRAVALADLSPGEVVSLELVDGLLSARAGPGGPSRGRVAAGARRGALVEVTDLEGIVPLAPARVVIRTISALDLADPRLPARLGRLAASDPNGLLAAYGLEAAQSFRSVDLDVPLTRFAVGAAAREASSLGVPSTIVVLEESLPDLLAEFAAPNAPPLEMMPLASGSSAPKKHRR
jgi:predicted transcriptional regulator